MKDTEPAMLLKKVNFEIVLSSLVILLKILSCTLNKIRKNTSFSDPYFPVEKIHVRENPYYGIFYAVINVVFFQIELRQSSFFMHVHFEGIMLDCTRHQL